MPVKYFKLDRVGSIKILKRQGCKNLKLSVSTTGEPKLTIPIWTPYKFALGFATKNTDWLLTQIAKNRTVLTTGMSVGRRHTLDLIPASGSRFSSQITSGVIKLKHPSHLSKGDEILGTQIQKSIDKAIANEANELLPARIFKLSTYHNLPYKQLTLKKLKAKWGSCSWDNRITLNTYLINLPDELIEYVIVHELAHTKVKNHSKNFWDFTESLLPGARLYKKQLRVIKPSHSHPQRQM